MTDADQPYTKVTCYKFEARVEWAILEFNDEWCFFEETRKNGQEDCHMSGEAKLIDGKWVLDKWARECIEMYESKDTADQVEAYFDEHGMPHG